MAEILRDEVSVLVPLDCQCKGDMEGEAVMGITGRCEPGAGGRCRNVFGAGVYDEDHAER